MEQRANLQQVRGSHSNSAACQACLLKWATRHQCSLPITAGKQMTTGGDGQSSDCPHTSARRRLSRHRRGDKADATLAGMLWCINHEFTSSRPPASCLRRGEELLLRLVVSGPCVVPAKYPSALWQFAIRYLSDPCGEPVVAPLEGVAVCKRRKAGNRDSATILLQLRRTPTRSFWISTLTGSGTPPVTK